MNKSTTIYRFLVQQIVLDFNLVHLQILWTVTRKMEERIREECQDLLVEEELVVDKPGLCITDRLVLMPFIMTRRSEDKIFGR